MDESEYKGYLQFRSAGQPDGRFVGTSKNPRYPQWIGVSSWTYAQDEGQPVSGKGRGVSLHGRKQGLAFVAPLADYAGDLYRAQTQKSRIDEAVFAALGRIACEYMRLTLRAVAVESISFFGRDEDEDKVVAFSLSFNDYDSKQIDDCKRSQQQAVQPQHQMSMWSAVQRLSQRIAEVSKSINKRR